MATTNDTVCAADMEYLLSALNHAASPIVINVASLAASRGAVVKMTGGRVKAIAKRYGLEITTNTKGEVNGNAAVATPTRVKATATGGRKRKTPVGKSNGKAKGSTKELNGEGDEEEEEVKEGGSENEENSSPSSPDMEAETPTVKKAKLFNVKVEQEDDSAGEEAAADDGECTDAELA